MGKLGWNRFAIILKLPVEESLEIAENLALMLDSQSIDIEGTSYYLKLIFGERSYRQNTKHLSASWPPWMRLCFRRVGRVMVL